MKKNLLFTLAVAVAGLVVVVAVQIFLAQTAITPLAQLANLTARPQPQLFINNGQFTTGANYPWSLNCGFGANSWGHYGVSNPDCAIKVDTDFAELQAVGVNVVRWWLFADFRSGLKLDSKGNILGVDDYVFADMDEAVSLANKHNIKIIFVLSDFMLFDKAQMVAGVQVFGRRDMIVDPARRQTLLDRVYKPIFQRYGQNSSIIAWDVINEPEWAMYVHTGEWIVPDRIDRRIMQSYVDQTVSYIHTYTNQWATVGSAKRGLLRLWTKSDLDFYQFHYYYKMERQYPLDYPAAALHLDRPVIVGEFPTLKGNRSVYDYLSIIAKNGYAGALPWSYNASDPYTSKSMLVQGILQYHQTHKP